MADIVLYSGHVIHLVDAPAGDDPAANLVSEENGALAVRDGVICGVGDLVDLRRRFKGAREISFGRNLLLPGFIDSHVHFPQMDIIGAYSGRLLEWLLDHTFPTEALFADEFLVRDAAAVFFRELHRNGTTTAMIYSSSHFRATDLLFDEFAAKGGRAVIGKCSMDRHAPEELLVSPAADQNSLEKLISRWHGHDDRLFVALTPRFAPACTEEMLAMLGDMRRSRPDLWVQTHLSENEEEIEWVAELYPDEPDYLAVYEKFNLLGERTVLAHCIHNTDAERQRMKAAGAVVAHCPSSNLFLGSGLFPAGEFRNLDIPVTLGSDVGGGTSLSMWKTMGDAWKVAALGREETHPLELFYQATLGGARALGLGRQTGNFAEGKAADFQVLDPTRLPLLERRLRRCENPVDILFALFFHADDRLTRHVFVKGRAIDLGEDDPSG